MCRHGALKSHVVHFMVPLPLIAQAIERRGDRDPALALFDEAVRLAPENALVRYRRAKILISMKKYDVSHSTVISRSLLVVLMNVAYSPRSKTWNTSVIHHQRSLMSSSSLPRCTVCWVMRSSLRNCSQSHAISRQRASTRSRSSWKQ
jgi:Oxygen-sensitive ribonucleoside-triphosphate reductase